MDKDKFNRCLLWSLCGLVCIWGLYRTPELGARFWPGLFYAHVLKQTEKAARAKREDFIMRQKRQVELAKELSAPGVEKPKREELTSSLWRSEALLARDRHYARLAAARLNGMRKLADEGYAPGLSCAKLP